MKIQRHLFSSFRKTGLRVALPMFLLFGIMDYLYMPSRWKEWIGLRVVFCLLFVVSFGFLRIKRFRAKYSQHLVVFNKVVACTILNIMIAQSGGHESLYLIGLILTSLIAIYIFKISPKFTLVSLFLCYGPTVGIITASAGFREWPIISLFVFYFSSLILLSHMFSRQNFDLLTRTVHREFDFKTQLKKLQKSAILNKQFPKSIRDSVEDGDEIVQKKFIANAVVGFADITNSTRLTNQIGLHLDWELKEAFTRVATEIATQHDFVVLTQLGDGFLFLANYEESNNWHFNLIGFCETLTRKFRNLKKDILPGNISEDIDVKFGAAMGPTLVGLMGEDQLYFTAIGPEVNLASRLCDKANGGEFVFSSKIWHILNSVGMPWISDQKVFTDLKGFDVSVSAVVVRPQANEAATHCVQCGEPLSLIMTENSHYDLRCPNGHVQAALEGSKRAV